MDLNITYGDLSKDPILAIKARVFIALRIRAAQMARRRRVVSK